MGSDADEAALVFTSFFFFWVLTHYPHLSHSQYIYREDETQPQFSSAILHCHKPTPAGVSELAHTEAALEESSKRVVGALYEALSTRDVETVHQLLAPDLEWWFHGPPNHQHLMRLLTGSSSSDDPFHFDPVSIVAFGSTVLVEGYEERRSVAWVHAWVVTDGIITQVREYFNTSVTVTRLSNTDKAAEGPSTSTTAARSVPCTCVWQSKVCESMGKSVPGLLLALQ
ncbi:hypothetical protein AAG906_032285 [Vitis piasezkii]